MPKITLPDGSERVYESPVLAKDIVVGIGKKLAKAALAVQLDDKIVDLSTLVEHDVQFKVITADSAEGLEVIRHSTAHLLAQAVKSLFPQAQVTIGPVIQNGFYYDFAFERPFTPEDLEKIEGKMKELTAQDITIAREVVERKNAVARFEAMGEHYKVEIIKELPENEDVSIYHQGDFVDLCRGPHVPSTGKLKAFKLTKVAGAYWRGDANNPMLQRIYGTAWASQKDLDAYLKQLEEAERRDHRRIGVDLDLFSIQDEAGGGLVFWHPMGGRIRRTIEDFWRDAHTRHGYELLFTPHIAHQELWKTSGHLEYYRDSMFSAIEVETQQYQLKPMNCPFHVLVYKSRLYSYRDFPIRWAELGTVYRNELSGALHGLMRVRGFTQDDAHIFCREDQIANEIEGVLTLTQEILGAFGFKEYEINLSTRPEKYVGDDALWEKATTALKHALENKRLEYTIDEGGGAFYGPKIDLKIKDAIGRKWQCSTIQLDFNLPIRFDMEYVGEDGERHRPIMVHRAIFGSVERFFGVLVEHYEGRFPTWIAPVQAVVLNITDDQAEYVREIAESLKKHGIRVETDLRNEKIGYKIRAHTLKRVPYLIVVGAREMEQRQIAVRLRNGKDLGTFDLDGFITTLLTDIRERRHLESEE